MKDFTSEDVAVLIAQLGCAVKGPFTLVFADDKLSLQKKFKKNPKDSVITVISQSEMRDGLTSRRWDFIEKALIKISVENQ